MSDIKTFRCLSGTYNVKVSVPDNSVFYDMISWLNDQSPILGIKQISTFNYSDQSGLMLWNVDQSLVLRFKLAFA